MDWLRKVYNSKIEYARAFFAFVILIYIVIACNSSGYYHWDEHYQIIEFANYKLGHAKLDDLAWEYKAHIRPSFQPVLCLSIFKLFISIGIADPYRLALILRITSALFSIFVIKKFINSNKLLVKEKNWIYYIFLSYFLWFIPYINVRFSSESWSGLVFLLVLTSINTITIKNRRRPFILIGILMGISILFRYQSALLVIGAICWMYFIGKFRFQEIALTACSTLLVLVLGAFMDWWFYGELTFTLLNYFNVNLIQGVASNYGTSPWYEIIFYILKSPGLFGILIFMSFLQLTIFKSRCLILWSIVPFLIVHSIIPHKELRFLFPIINIAPLLLILGYQEIRNNSFSTKKILFPLALTFLFLYNLAGLIATGTKGAGSGKITVAQYIHNHYAGRKVNLIFTEGLNPYTDWEYPKNTFYKPDGDLKTISSVWQPDFQNLKQDRKVNLLLLSKDDIIGPRTIELLQRLKYVQVYQSIPAITQKINYFYDKSLNRSSFILYELRDQ